MVLYASIVIILYHIYIFDATILYFNVTSGSLYRYIYRYMYLRCAHIFVRLSSDSVCILFIIYFYRWIRAPYSKNLARVKSLNACTEGNKEIEGCRKGERLINRRVGTTHRWLHIVGSWTIYYNNNNNISHEQMFVQICHYNQWHVRVFTTEERV